MKRDEVIAKLQARQGEIKAAGVEHVQLFGSTVRGDARPDSDIDLLVDINPSRKWTLVSVSHAQNVLSDIVGAEVDMCVRPWMRRAFAPYILAEAVDVF
jgi:predicted nucleotidyltransferase